MAAEIKWPEYLSNPEVQQQLLAAVKSRVTFLNELFAKHINYQTARPKAAAEASDDVINHVTSLAIDAVSAGSMDKEGKEMALLQQLVANAAAPFKEHPHALKHMLNHSEFNDVALIKCEEITRLVAIARSQYWQEKAIRDEERGSQGF